SVVIASFPKIRDDQNFSSNRPASAVLSKWCTLGLCIVSICESWLARESGGRLPMEIPEMRRGVRVVGVGSPHGDDRVGWRLVEDLAESAGPGVEAVVVAQPLGLLDYLDGCSALIVVDG